MRYIIALIVLLISSPALAAPNIILIIADDLGYGELGSYGQKKIRTPALDQLTKEGMRFTQYYAGNAVCATSRCVLMTGQHTGHCIVRDNRQMKPEGQFPLPDNAVTIPELLKQKGYVTGAMGKWGLGPPGSTGDPNKQGLDLFFGYNCQAHAHSHYPTYLWRNDQRETFDGKQFSQDLFEAEALKFIAANKEKPFFLYLPFIIPHLALQVPEDSLAEYKGKWEDPPYDGKNGYLPHPHPRAAYAAMITRMDRSIGRIMAKLKELDLDDNTLVLFTSDNGPTYDRLGGSDSDFFNSAPGLRGLKGSLYEGGIRVPLIVRWPKQITAGTTSDFVCAAQDVLPTLCEIAEVKPPADIDGLSLTPTLFAKGEQPKHPYLYWEFPSYGGQQAALIDGRYKAIRQQMAKGKLDIELYDLQTDLAESKNLASDQPELIKRAEMIFAEAHVPSPDFPLPGVDKKSVVTKP
jgi:arylsulfatase